MKTDYICFSQKKQDATVLWSGTYAGISSIAGTPVLSHFWADRHYLLRSALPHVLRLAALHSKQRRPAGSGMSDFGK